jgi:beta-lactamase superfamily II metal-dependent hydrolase
MVEIRNFAKEIFNKNPLVYDSGEKCTLLLFTQVEKTVFDDFCKGLQENFPCLLINENTIENNFFNFYKINDMLVCAGYFECDKSVRIVFDDKTALPSFTQSDFQKKCGTTLWQFEVDHSLIDCGMCYIIQTNTGAFFVIDSAHTYSMNDCDRIYNFLRARTPRGEKVHIAGWFITHFHDDHVVQFTNYLKYHMDDTVIDAIYHNCISVNHRDGTDWMYANKMFSLNTEAEIARHPDIPVVLLHTGMTFYVDNLKIDTLCSHEDVFPGDNSNYNDSSVVIMITAEGNKILIPGDAGHEESYILEARYPEYLKSDIVQQAHHGHFGTTENFYKLVDADLVLFPVTQIIFDKEFQVYPENKLAIDLADGNYYIASNGTVEIPLPYVRGKEKLYPDETFESFKGVFDLWAYEYDKEYKERLYNEYLSRGGKPLDEYKNGF